MLVQFALFMAVVAAALIIDVYSGNNTKEIEKTQAESQKHASEPGSIYIIAQSGSLSLKTSVHKSPTRDSNIQLHDKFLRKYHQIRNYQVLKAEVKSHAVPIIQSYHYLVFQNYFYTNPDEHLLS